MHPLYDDYKAWQTPASMQQLRKGTANILCGHQPPTTAIKCTAPAGARGQHSATQRRSMVTSSVTIEALTVTS